ncbi:helix-turn-helix domain-containing protein [Streptomyces mirabilis]|uniref:Helix-turn-helix domain-containing protein n=1 Tax=Streptomyces mirabilis TaxID=68239 RepID=A0A1I2WTT0_9ACTN|nr:helix-turn-helix transcriptional regulator [Streptomyces mirabilis]SFH04642.1 Helix-turn-helix domain-containing protein [Streptomyces mirabilis]
MTDTASVPAGRTQRPGRPELAIAGSDPVLAFIAHRLRELRTAADLTYRRLEEITGFSATQLKRAGRGERTTVDVVVAYAQGCNATAEDIRNLDLLHTTLAGSMRPASETAAPAAPAVSRGPAPAPEQIATAAHLTYAIDRTWRHAGRPSLRTIEAKSGELIPRSTASRILKGATFPDEPRRFHALLTALDVEVDQLVAWFGAWIRVVTPELTSSDQYELAEQLGGEARIAFHLAAERHHAERGESDVRARLAPLPPHIREQVLAYTDAQLDVLLGNGRKTPRLTLHGNRDNPTRPLRSIA